MKCKKKIPVPAGYWLDHRGNLVAEDNVKEIDKLRDEVTREIAKKAQAVNAILADFKREVFGDIAAFVQLSAEKYRAHIGGTKGNVTLLSYDGSIKVQRSIAERMVFDERLQAAKQLIDECLHEWTEGASSEIRTLINDAFRVDQAGNLRTGNILSLRRLEITDERWMRAMQAIGDALQVVGSKSYVRVYLRDDDTGEYIALPLDLAAV